MLKALKYAGFVFMAFCTLFVVLGVGSGFVKGLSKPRPESPTSSGVQRDIWIARFKPTEMAGQCTDSPLQRSLDGSYNECLGIVEPLFDHCASSRIFHIPGVIGSQAEAEKYGSLTGECITAYYLGGSYISVFQKSLQKPTKA